MIQDVFSWFVRRFFHDEAEERHVEQSEAAFRKQVDAHGSTVAAAERILDGIFGTNRMREHSREAGRRKVSVAPRFESRVYPSFQGSCGAS